MIVIYCSTAGLRSFFKVSALRLKPFESLRRAEGKGVKRSDHRERSSQFSLSALNSLQGVDFQPCRLFCAQKDAPKMHRPHFLSFPSTKMPRAFTHRALLVYVGR